MIRLLLVVGFPLAFLVADMFGVVRDRCGR